MNTTKEITINRAQLNRLKAHWLKQFAKKLTLPKMKELELKIKCLELASQTEVIGEHKLTVAKEFFAWIKESIPEPPAPTS